MQLQFPFTDDVKHSIFPFVWATMSTNTIVLVYAVCCVESQINMFNINYVARILLHRVKYWKSPCFTQCFTYELYDIMMSNAKITINEFYANRENCI